MNSRDAKLMSHADRDRIKAAACDALELWPGPIGEIVCSTLYPWAEWGWKLDADGLVWRTVREIEAVRKQRRVTARAAASSARRPAAAPDPPRRTDTPSR